VLILKIDKVLCFHALLQVLVLKVLKVCTKIVQMQGVPAYGEEKTDLKSRPKKQKRQQNAGATGWNAILPKEYGTRGATFCQGKKSSRIFGCASKVVRWKLIEPR
jgi:hypothetical protein